LPGILCVLPPSAVHLLRAGRKLEPREMGRTQRKTAAARYSLRTSSLCGVSPWGQQKIGTARDGKDAEEDSGCPVFSADFLPLRFIFFGPDKNRNRERWEGRRGRQRLPGILCGLPPSAVHLLRAGRKSEPREMGRTQRKTAVAPKLSSLNHIQQHATFGGRVATRV